MFSRVFGPGLFFFMLSMLRSLYTNPYTFHCFRHFFFFLLVDNTSASQTARGTERAVLDRRFPSQSQRVVFQTAE